jgi:two-component system cell cycle sensor histidine kinase PleC
VSTLGETVANWIQLTNDVVSSSEAAVDVLNDLLNYDKIEMGTLRLEFSSIPIWQLVKKTAAGFVMQAKQKEIEYVTYGDAWAEGVADEKLSVYEELHVVGDSGRISQILRNLLTNALKFTPEKGRVTVRGKTVFDDTIIGYA